jgi:hypothetical protein
MTPQEQQLVAELFDRLSKLETAPRDPDAERLIADGARQAPHALYALVQTVLVQDEALKRASTRIQDLQQQLESLAGEEPQQQQGSFLDTMRDAVFGHGADHGAPPRGSVPSVQGPAYQSQQGYVSPRAAPGFPAQPPYPAGAGFGPMGGSPMSGAMGGSFLGTAASAAAGVIGGGLMLDGIRSMFGHRSGGNDAFASLFSRDQSSSRSSAADSDLARQAGIDDIGRHDDSGRHNFVANQVNDQDLTPADEDQFVDDGNFDTADSGGGDDSYDV